MSEPTPQVFPFSLPEKEEDRHEAIKWNIGAGRYEIHVPILSSYETKDILPHCLMMKAKVEAAVSNDAHLGQSLYRVFPRTLSPVLRAVWPSIIEADPADTQNNTELFEQRIRDLIAVHATEDDRHDLVMQMCSPRKPREVPVQTFFYRLRELNQFVEWLPGNAAPLNEVEMRQAFYDSMPQTWKDRFQQAGNSHTTMTLAQLT